MTSSVREIVAAYLGLDVQAAVAVARRAPKTYRRYFVPKKSGSGMRAIFHPSKETKALQYALLETVLPTLPIHDAATGYVRGIRSPLLRNAQAHCEFQFTVRLDFKDFFPSIVPDDLLGRLVALDRWKNMDEEDRQFVADAAFIQFQKQLCLAIGAPSSPMISNAVMYELDRRLQAFANERNGAYTRYADDLFYSTNAKGQCREFVRHIVSELSEMESPRLVVNGEKTLYMSRGTRRAVTGLMVTPQGDVSVGRVRKRYIRGLIHRYQEYLAGRTKFEEERTNELRGLLAFVLDVEPSFYNRLAQKYGAKTVNAALFGKRKSDE
jgi:retron-type reverse transcriptase